MQVEFNAKKREAHGSSASRSQRRAGITPGIVYGGEAAPMSIELDHNDLYHALRKEAFHASIINLSIDGNVETVVLRDTQWHPYKQLVLHVDFQRVAPDQKIHLKVPLHFTNADNAPGVKIGGGKPHHIVTELDVECLPGRLPEYIEVDMGKLEAGQSIHATELKMPIGVALTAHIVAENPAVANISSPKGGAAEEAPAAE